MRERGRKQNGGKVGTERRQEEVKEQIGWIGRLNEGMAEERHKE